MKKSWMKMEATLVHLYFFLILMFTFCLERCDCEAAEVLPPKPLKTPCNQPIDCGRNHVIAIFRMVDGFKNRTVRAVAKNRCNGKHKCDKPSIKNANCSMEYYCIDDSFVQNCSVMDIPRISENSDLFWCYQRTKQQRNETCWEFSDDVFHHWIILRGTAKLNGMELTNFNLITRNNKSKVCTTNKYIWIIYVGRKSSETPVNIYSKTNQTQTISDRRVTEKKDPSERGITKDEQNSVNQDSTTGFLVDKKESEAGKLVKDMDFMSRKSSETPVNIYSKTNQTQTISDRRVTEKKDPSERGITKDEQNSVNQDSTTGFLVDKKESEAGKLVKDMDFMSRKSSETPVNIYQTQTISHRRVAEKKDPSEDGITKDEQNSGNQDISELVKDMSFMKIIILISAIGGVMLILAITISILCCCCHRCNKATITESVPEPKKDNVKKNVKDENLEDAVKNVAKDVVKVAIPEAPNCQMREGFVPHEAMRDTFDSVGFWSEDEDYNPEDNNRHSKMKPGIYAVSDRLYKRKSPQSDIYMNPVVPPPPSYQKDTDTYINMNQKPKPPNKQFNIFL